MSLRKERFGNSSFCKFYLKKKQKITEEKTTKIQNIPYKTLIFIGHVKFGEDKSNEKAFHTSS